MPKLFCGIIKVYLGTKKIIFPFMQVPIIKVTKEQLVNFILKDVSEEERQMIIEAINTKPEIKERYLFEKRKHDIKRYIDDEMNIGECFEIEELIKTDSRLYDHFELNNGVFKYEQDETMNHEQIPVTDEQLIKFVLNAVYEDERQQITNAINTNSDIKERYLFEKRRYDIERYLDNKMDIGERCEIEELLKTNSKLFDYFELKKYINIEEQNTSINIMHTSILNEQIINFVLNNVNDEEREMIIELINTNSEIKEKYLFEKRKHDVERYVNDEMTIGEQCEIEELIKTDSRLYDHFVLNTEAASNEEKEVSKKPKQIRITKEQLAKFILNEVFDEAYLEEYENISEAINTDPLIRERFLFEKRKHDAEKYLEDKMDFEERCEFEELLKSNLRLYEYFELKNDVNEEEQNVTINGKQIAITKEKLANFILNDVNDEEHEMISEAIITNSFIKERYLFEKRKYDVERYIDNEMTIGERCEIEELIKMDSRLLDYFELNNGVIKEDDDESTILKQIAVTEKQLVNFVLNNVSEAEHKKISEAINTNPVTKERYLLEKRKHDVERYIEDDVTIAERCEIEELLETNSRLQLHFELLKDINKYLQKGLKEQLNNIHDEIYSAFNNNENGIRENEVSFKDTLPLIQMKFNVGRIGKWVAAASIIILMGLGGVNVYLNNTVSLENRLYASYYEPYSQMSAHLFNSSKLSEAKRLYSEGEFATALLLLDNLQEVLLVQNEKYIYSGMALIELNRHKEAIEMFTKLNASAGNETDVLIGYWYTGLCYLKIEDTENAIKYFRIIIANNGYNRKQAKEILEKLN
jgi:peptidyl-tRNA hydrolase